MFGLYCRKDPILYLMSDNMFDMFAYERQIP